MPNKKYVDENTLLYYTQLIKNILDKKVSAEDGKGLSTNDLTDELLQKIQNAGDSSFSGNYNDLTNKPDLASIIEAYEYKNATEIQSLINESIKDITSIKYLVVEQLPSTGAAGTIYLKSNSGSNDNIYDEYIYLNNKFEKIGTTDVDLSGYVKISELVVVENTEIESIFTQVFGGQEAD